MIKKFIAKNTKKYGKGNFATKDIKKGEVVFVLGGKRFDVSEFANKVNSGKEYIDDPFQIGRRTYIDLNETSRTFNHSCNPSCGIRKNSELFALRDIKKGEELTFDYSLTIAPTEWSMKCKCGTKACRKTLGDIVSIPKKRREEYKEAGAIQSYMKKLLKIIDLGKYKTPAYEQKALDDLKKANS